MIFSRSIINQSRNILFCYELDEKNPILVAGDGGLRVCSSRRAAECERACDAQREAIHGDLAWNVCRDWRCGALPMEHDAGPACSAVDERHFRRYQRQPHCRARELHGGGDSKGQRKPDGDEELHHHDSV